MEMKTKIHLVRAEQNRTKRKIKRQKPARRFANPSGRARQAGGQYARRCQHSPRRSGFFGARRAAKAGERKESTNTHSHLRAAMDNSQAITTKEKAERRKSRKVQDICRQRSTRAAPCRDDGKSGRFSAKSHFRQQNPAYALLDKGCASSMGSWCEIQRCAQAIEPVKGIISSEHTLADTKFTCGNGGPRSSEPHILCSTQLLPPEQAFVAQ